MKTAFTNLKNWFKPRGWMLLLPETLKYDYQAHGFGGFVIAIFAKSLCVVWLSDLPNLVNTLIAANMVLALGYLIELTQLFKKDREFEHYDAWIMYPMALLMGLIFDFIRVFSGVDIPIVR
jgi:hypothetical protein